MSLTVISTIAYLFFGVLYGILAWHYSRHPSGSTESTNLCDYYGPTVSRVAYNVSQPWHIRMRMAIASLAAISALSLIWPIICGISYTTTRLQFKRAGRFGPASTMATGALYSFSPPYGIVLLPILIISLGIALMTNSSGLYLIGMSILFVSATCLLHVSYITSPISLPVRIRQSLGSPIRKFVALVLCDFLVLAVGLGFVLHPSRDLTILSANIIATGIDLLRKYNDIRVITHAPLLRGNWAVVLCGLLYSTAIIKTCCQWREFRRNDNDHENLAILLAKTGRYRQALQEMESVKGNESAGSCVAKAVIYAGLERYKESWDAARLAYCFSFGEMPGGEGVLTQYLIFLLKNNQIRSHIVLHLLQNVSTTDAQLAWCTYEAKSYTDIGIQSIAKCIPDDYTITTAAANLFFRGSIEDANAALTKSTTLTAFERATLMFFRANEQYDRITENSIVSTSNAIHSINAYYEYVHAHRVEIEHEASCFQLIQLFSNSNVFKLVLRSMSLAVDRAIKDRIAEISSMDNALLEALKVKKGKAEILHFTKMMQSGPLINELLELSEVLNTEKHTSSNAASDQCNPSSS